MAAIHEFQVKLVHLDSKSNRLSDLLSRWDLDPSNRVKFFEAARDFELSEYRVPCQILGNTYFSDKQLADLKKDLNTSRKNAYAVGTAKNLRIQWESFFYYFVSFFNFATYQQIQRLYVYTVRFKPFLLIN